MDGGLREATEVVVLGGFFFQAEDGIRDWSVTGVQTCALPISHPRGRRVPDRDRGPGGAPQPRALTRTRRPLVKARWPPERRAGVARPAKAPPEQRSEERRVGKGRRGEGAAGR